jgi:hypothetical protein
MRALVRRNNLCEEVEELLQAGKERPAASTRPMREVVPA